jgi:hypothetical protein
MKAYKEHPGMKVSCACSDEIKNVSPVEAVKAAFNGCKECGQDYVISVNFQKGGK